MSRALVKQAASVLARSRIVGNDLNASIGEYLEEKHSGRLDKHVGFGFVRQAEDCHGAIGAKLIADENVILTSILAEDIQVAATGLRFEHAQVLKREWSARPRG